MGTGASTTCLTDDLLEALACGQAVDEAAHRHAKRCEGCRIAVQDIRENNMFLATFVPAVRNDAAGEDGPLPTEDAIAGYRIVTEIHRGGQGVVYEAVQESTRRIVAIKVLREGRFAGPRDKARFEREVHILGRLHHPNIVTIHDSGTAAGRFYLVMNHISGQPLDTYMQEKHLGVRDTLRLFATICEAVSAAHLHGVIHRDLKPSNILVDEDGRPYVLDFGLAKMEPSAEHDSVGAPAVTRTGHFAGSLPWASPEQAEGVPAGIDVRTDVYSLGVILYQMLTGRFPYAVIGNMRDVLDNILTAEPAGPRVLRPEIGDETETMVLKCLAKQPERRYQSAVELTRDVRRYLAGEPIDAKRDSTWYVLTKAARRYKMPLGAAAVLALMLAVFAVAMTIQANRVAEQRDRAVRAEHDARSRAVKLSEMLRENRIERGRMMRLAGNTALAEELIWRGHLTPLQGPPGGPTASTDKQARHAHSHWALWELYAGDPCLKTIDAGRVSSAALSPDGGTLATGGREGRVKLWDLPSLQERRTLEGHDGGISELRFAPDGAALATASSDGAVRVWRVSTGDLLATLADHRAPVRSVDFSPDGGRLVSCSAGEQTIRLWERSTGRCLTVWRVPDRSPTGVRWTSDGEHVVSIHEGGAMWLWNVESGRRKEGWQTTEHAHSFDLTTDGRCAVWGGGTLHLGHVGRGQSFARLHGHSGATHAARFSPDGRMLASGGFDRTVRLWDAVAGRLVQTLRGHLLAPGDVCLTSADRGRVVSVGPTIKLWETRPNRCLRLLSGHDATVFAVAFSPCGVRLASCGGTTIRTWSPSSGETLMPGIPAHSAAVAAVCYSPDGKSLASASYDTTVKLWDAATGKRLKTFREHEARVNFVRYHPNGSMLASCDNDGLIRLWDAASSRTTSVLKGHANRIAALAFAPDGRKLVSGSNDQTVRLWDLDTGKTQVLAGHEGPVRCVGFNPSGRLVASTGDDRTIRLWDTTSGACHTVLEGHVKQVFALAFRPDGLMLATGDRGGSIKLWDMSSPRLLATLEGHGDAIFGLAFASDGDTLASASADGDVGLWDLRHYDRHIAGNLEYQISRRLEEQRDAATISGLRRWAADVIARTSP